eukprot:6208295-Pleurochrysis_carterae.AAC.1
MSAFRALVNSPNSKAVGVRLICTGNKAICTCHGSDKAIHRRLQCTMTTLRLIQIHMLEKEEIKNATIACLLNHPRRTDSRGRAFLNWFPYACLNYLPRINFCIQRDMCLMLTTIRLNLSVWLQQLACKLNSQQIAAQAETKQQLSFASKTKV